MIFITLAIILLVLAATVLFILRPLISNNDASLMNSGMDSVSATAEYQVTLNRIRELKQELQDGKINEDDYNERRNKLNDEAADFLQQMRSAE